MSKTCGVAMRSSRSADLVLVLSEFEVARLGIKVVVARDTPAVHGVAWRNWKYGHRRIVSVSIHALPFSRREILRRGES